MHAIASGIWFLVTRIGNEYLFMVENGQTIVLHEVFVFNIPFFFCSGIFKVKIMFSTVCFVWELQICETLFAVWVAANLKIQISLSCLPATNLS